METFPDLGALSDQELKDLIQQLTEEETELSYRRRILHGKIDILRAELVNRLRKKHEVGEPVITGADVQQLTAFVGAHPLTILTAYRDMDARFAVVAWGYRLLSQSLDLNAFAAFYAEDQELLRLTREVSYREDRGSATPFEKISATDEGWVSQSTMPFRGTGDPVRLWARFDDYWRATNPRPDSLRLRSGEAQPIGRHDSGWSVSVGVSRWKAGANGH